MLLLIGHQLLLSVFKLRMKYVCSDMFANLPVSSNVHRNSLLLLTTPSLAQLLSFRPATGQDIALPSARNSAVLVLSPSWVFFFFVCVCVCVCVCSRPKSS